MVKGKKLKKKSLQIQQIARSAVDSLFDKIEDGSEYKSIVNLVPKSGSLDNDLRKAIASIEEIRERPLLCYFANVVKPTGDVAINSSDDLPFNEMIAKVDTTQKIVDVMVVTPGGSGQQVSQFVNTLRPRFDTIEFLLPYMCMSAGTLWILSGDKTWMDKRAYIGPIDPQVRLPDGTSVPAQSILILLEKIREDGQQCITKGMPLPWDLIRIIDNIDARLLGDAIAQSDYAIKMAKDFLVNYKFKNWTVHSTTGNPVTREEKESRAKETAELLCSHKYWKSHAHGITRDMAKDPLLIKIEEIESIPGLESAIRKLWALVYWLFDRGPIYKLFISRDYLLVRQASTIKIQ